MMDMLNWGIWVEKQEVDPTEVIMNTTITEETNTAEVIMITMATEEINTVEVITNTMMIEETNLRWPNLSRLKIRNYEIQFAA